MGGERNRPWAEVRRTKSLPPGFPADVPPYHPTELQAGAANRRDAVAQGLRTSIAGAPRAAQARFARALGLRGWSPQEGRRAAGSISARLSIAGKTPSPAPAAPSACVTGGCGHPHAAPRGGWGLPRALTEGRKPPEGLSLVLALLQLLAQPSSHPNTGTPPPGTAAPEAPLSPGLATSPAARPRSSP